MNYMTKESSITYVFNPDHTLTCVSKYPSSFNP